MGSPTRPEVGLSVEPADPVIAAAGDIACIPGATVTATRCHQEYTSDLLIDAGLAAVLPLGDEQYPYGEYDNFLGSYDPTWGRVNSISHPVPGNHEYGTAGAAGYFQYFGATAGDPTKGYYSFDVGAWHLIALNSNCSKIGGCGVGSAQEQWLRADLASHPADCTLAYWHHPRFSSGTHGNSTSVQALWQALYDHGADLVLSAHDHTYERFAPQTPTGVSDPTRGIREFVVGTGGKSLYAMGTLKPNSEVFRNDTFGILKLTLHPTGYDWAFVPEAGKTWTDSGSATCFAADPPPGNEPPVAAGDSYTTTSGAPLNVVTPGVLVNDSDPDGDAITARNASDPDHGSVTLNTDGSFTYTPDAGYTGPDSFTYTAFDGTADSAPATVSITVSPAPEPTTYGATEDAYVKETFPGVIFNTTVLQIYRAVNSSATNEQWTYLKFTTDVAGSARLRLLVVSGSSSSNFGDAYAVGSGWSEGSLTWNTKPPLGGMLDSSHRYVSGWVEWDLGTLPAGTHSFVVANTGSTVRAFASSEATTIANRPQLVITPPAP